MGGTYRVTADLERNQVGGEGATYHDTHGTFFESAAFTAIIIDFEENLSPLFIKKAPLAVEFVGKKELW